MFALFFFALFGLFAFVVWLGCLILFVAGRKQKSRAMAWLGGVPLALLSASGVVVAGWILYVSIVPTHPADAYKSAFGVTPSNDVVDLQSQDESFGDSGLFYLKFKASPATIAHIMAHGWKHIPAKNGQADDAFSPDSDAPQWWRPQQSAQTEVFLTENRTGHHTIENEILIYNAGTQQAYYSYSSID